MSLYLLSYVEMFRYRRQKKIILQDQSCITDSSSVALNCVCVCVCIHICFRGVELKELATKTISNS
jgi:hypothetical protein